jgi:uncharacterized protein YkwD
VHQREKRHTKSYEGTPKTFGTVVLSTFLSLLCACLLSAVSPAAASDTNLFADYVGPIQLDATLVNQRLVLRERLVRVRLEVLTQADTTHISLNLFDDLSLTATLDHEEWNASGGFAWIGYVDETRTSKATLVVADRSLAGTLRWGGTTYQVRPVAEDAHVIREIRLPARPASRSLAELDSYSIEQEVSALVNQEREVKNLPPFKWNDKLFAAARGHSVDMAEHDYFSHDSLDGREFFERITTAGYQWSACAENIAAGYTSPETVMNGWMASPGHRANILSTGYCDIGVGYAYDDASTYGHYWTQDFGRQKGVSVCPAAEFIIEATAESGGNISPSGSVAVTSGATQTFRIAADGGYEISRVEVDGASVGAVSEYTFEYVTIAHTIKAFFRRVAPRAMPWIMLLLDK